MPKTAAMPNNSTFCHVFCTVIDNFGDIGVSWRLANILRQELGWKIVFWLDNEAALRQLCPDLPPLPCSYRQVSIRRWQEGFTPPDWASAPAPDVVIETFGCRLSDEVRHAIGQNHALWLNWEYLSAEEWAADMHAKPSPQADGTRKFFWLMGFDARGGGLLREKDYAEYCRFDAADLRGRLKLPTKTSPEWLLFGYRSPIWAKWLQTLKNMGHPLTLLLAGGQIADSLKQSGALPGYSLKHDGDIFQDGRIRLVKIPFVPQEHFDRLLYLSDGLVVRGEDSFVRAQFSGKPFFWHIYLQDEMAHLDKLDAFWRQAYPYYPAEIAAAHRVLSAELNGAGCADESERLDALQTLWMNTHLWQNGTQAWRQHLFRQQTAAEKLANFIKHR